MTTLEGIVQLHDDGKTADEIAKLLHVSLGYVYSILRKERPNRERKEHRRTSEIPAEVVTMFEAGIKATQIAKRLKISRAYVYKCLPRQKEES